MVSEYAIRLRISIENRSTYKLFKIKNHYIRKQLIKEDSDLRILIE